MVHAATFEYESTANIVLIPMLSGYRDSHTLKLSVEHNYSSWYAEHGITLDSEPKNAMAFRKVIMLDQIESFSLFDPASATALSMGKTIRRASRRVVKVTSHHRQISKSNNLGRMQLGVNAAPVLLC